MYFKETKSSSGLSASNVSARHTFFQGAAALLGALILQWLGFFFGSNKVAARQGNLSLIPWGHYITVSLEEGVEEGRGGGWIRELVHKFDWIKLLPQSGVVFHGIYPLVSLNQQLCVCFCQAAKLLQPPPKKSLPVSVTRTYTGTVRRIQKHEPSSSYPTRACACQFVNASKRKNKQTKQHYVSDTNDKKTNGWPSGHLFASSGFLPHPSCRPPHKEVIYNIKIWVRWMDYAT